MIKLSGKYDIGGQEYIKCEIHIKRGMLNLIKKDTKLGNVTNPIVKNDYKIIKTDEEYGLPVTHKYAIKFNDYYNKETYVYTDMALFQKWWIEIRKNKAKFNIVKVVSFISLALATFILNDFYNILKPRLWYNEEPVSISDTISQKSDSPSMNNQTIIKNKYQIDSITEDTFSQKDLLDQNIDTTINL